MIFAKRFVGVGVHDVLGVDRGEDNPLETFHADNLTAFTFSAMAFDAVDRIQVLTEDDLFGKRVRDLDLGAGCRRRSDGNDCKRHQDHQHGGDDRGPFLQAADESPNSFGRGPVLRASKDDPTRMM